MEKPITYYEQALVYAARTGTPVPDIKFAELIAMVKARDNEIVRLNGQSMFLCQCGGVNKQIAESIELLGKRDAEIDNQARKIAELKQAVSPASCTLDDSIKVGFAVIGLDGGNNKFLYQHQVYGSKFSATGNFDLYAIASQQGGEVK